MPCAPPVPEQPPGDLQAAISQEKRAHQVAPLLGIKAEIILHNDGAGKADAVNVGDERTHACRGQHLITHQSGLQDNDLSFGDSLFRKCRFLTHAFLDSVRDPEVQKITAAVHAFAASRLLLRSAWPGRAARRLVSWPWRLPRWQSGWPSRSPVPPPGRLPARR